MILLNKETARKRGLQNRRELGESLRREYSAKIERTVLERCCDHRVIGIYVSIGTEADTRGIIRRLLEDGRTVAVPKTHEDTLTFHVITSLSQLKPGAWNIPEPGDDGIIPPDETDVMIVPLSAFDTQGHRTGYGKGYYDRILSGCRLRIGIGFSCQQAEQIETDEYDVGLDEIITERGILKCERPQSC